MQRMARALADALRAQLGAERFGVDGRLLDWTDNLVDGIEADELAAQAGLTGQLGWRAPDSAAMLAINSFFPWRHSPGLLPLAGRLGFEVLRFGARCPSGVRGTPPHLDLLALRGDAVVAVTAHSTDYLGRRRARLAPAYEALNVDDALLPWHEQMRQLREEPASFHHVDVCALVKFAFGLGRTFPDRPVTLLYAFWEPLDAPRFPAFAHHREELARLARAVGDAAVRLQAQSFPELWAEWERAPAPGWLPEQVARLRRRYAVALEPQPRVA